MATLTRAFRRAVPLLGDLLAALVLVAGGAVLTALATLV